MSEPEPFVVEAAGDRLRAIRYGCWSGHDRVLVFLHEGLGSIGQWRGFPEALCAATGLAGLVYERAGYGRSSPSGVRQSDFLVREAEEVLPAVLTACGVGRPLLFGHSDGGTIALLYAAAFPDSPVAAITEAAHVLQERVTREALLELRARWATDERLRAGLARHHADAEATFFGWIDAWLRPENASWHMEDRLGAIRCPLLVIQGDADEHGTPLQVERILETSGGPTEAFMVPDCHHVPHLEQAEAVLARSTAFIAAVLAGEAAEGGAVR